MNTYIASILGIILWAFAASSHAETVGGGSLYLNRSGVETHRAEFNFAQDCELVAKAMNEKEPLVEWYCSTSQPSIEYDCNIQNVTIENWEGTKSTSDLKFSILMTRGKARTTLSDALGSFNYEQTDSIIKLSNDYPYLTGNYLSKAITYIRIDTVSGITNILNYGLTNNGKGTCKLVESATN